MYISEFYVKYTGLGQPKYDLTFENFSKLNIKYRSITIGSRVFDYENKEVENIHVTLCYIPRGTVDIYTRVKTHLETHTYNGPWNISPSFLCKLGSSIVCVVKFDKEQDETIARELNYYGSSEAGEKQRLYHFTIPVLMNKNREMMRKFDDTPEKTLTFARSFSSLKWCNYPNENNPGRYKTMVGYC